LSAQNQGRPSGVDPGQSGLEPIPYRVLVHPKQLRDLFHGVAPMNLYAARVKALHPLEPVLMRARISSVRHVVMRGPSLTGLGYLPVLTPAHQVDLLTGIGPLGAMIEARRISPVSGKVGSKGWVSLVRMVRHPTKRSMASSMLSEEWSES
jgi:hypothetical protein